jgi:hypothetical protein
MTEQIEGLFKEEQQEDGTEAETDDPTSMAMELVD